MTKNLRRLAMFTIVCVAVGAAALTSCGKDDEVINDVPAMEMKSDNLPPIRTTLKFYVWIEEDTVDSCGNSCRIRKCVPGVCGEICAVSISKEELDGTGIHVVTKPKGDGTIGGLEIENSNMPSDIKNSFLKYVEKGTITFAVNCPITDPELLAVLTTNHIPAGTYPIRLENDNFVITISE